MRSDGSMELTAGHREILEAIGPSGATNQQLGDLVNRPVFAQLVDGGYMRSEQFELQETDQQSARLPHEQVLRWQLTPRGTQALNVPPFDE